MWGRGYVSSYEQKASETFYGYDATIAGGVIGISCEYKCQWRSISALKISSYSCSPVLFAEKTVVDFNIVFYLQYNYQATVFRWS